jgi:uncharacterized protein YceH (UPF0502 family)
MVDFELTDTEVRVLGCLIEKEMTTPEYYPLSLNALVNACNQKSNRNPVVSYDESTVLQALGDLKEIHFAWQSDAARVPKYEHLFAKTFNLVAREMAILCVLMVRGPQTIGELRARSERMYAFSDLDEVSETISNLEEMSLIRQVPRQPGQKESRFVHLLAGEPKSSTVGDDALPGEANPQIPARKDRIAALEDEVRSLREELEEVKKDFQEFKRQFE